MNDNFYVMQSDSSNVGGAYVVRGFDTEREARQNCASACGQYVVDGETARRWYDSNIASYYRDRNI